MSSLALLPNLMGPDGLLIFLFVLLFFGAKRLPELAKGLGSAVREFSKAKDEIEHEITRAPAPQIEPPREVVTPHLQAAPSTVAQQSAPIIGASAPIAPAAMSETHDPMHVGGNTEEPRRSHPTGDPMV